MSSNFNFETTFHHVSDLVFVVDNNGSIIKGNSSVTRVLGYEEEEYIGKQFVEYSCKSDYDMLCCEFQKATQGKSIDTLLYRAISKSGNYVWLNLKTFSNTKTKEIHVFARNVTVELESQKELENSELRYKALVNAVPLAIGMVVNDRIAFMNEYGVSLLGYESLSQIRGTIFSALIQTKYSTVVQEQVSQLQQKCSSQAIEVEVRTEAEKDIRVELLMVQLDATGNRDFIVIISDLTERVGTEKLLEKKIDELQQKECDFLALKEKYKNEKIEFQKKIQANIDSQILPVLGNLKEMNISEVTPYLTMLDEAVSSLTDSFGVNFQQYISQLSSKEQAICLMIKQGLNSKSIADILGLSYQTVETHRRNIRKKLEINNNGLSLANYLKTISYSK